MKHGFSILLVMVVLSVIGLALAPRLDIADRPRPERGKTLTVSYGWQGVAAKVVEQNVTSRIEALASSVRGVAKVSSVSEFGSGRVVVELKPQADVSATKFEIASLLRGLDGKLPEGVTHPVLSGGEIDTEAADDKEVKLLLSYQVSSRLPDAEVLSLAGRQMRTPLERIEGVHHVDITGGVQHYMEISYDARQLSSYGITSADVAEAVRNFAGREEVVGSIRKEGAREKVAVALSTPHEPLRLERIPVRRTGGKIVYLNDLATLEIKRVQPDSYYRVNGLSTIYINVYAGRDADIVGVAGDVKEALEGVSLRLEKTYDRAEEQLAEVRTLVSRTAATLAILLVFVWLGAGRSWKYLAIIASTLAASVCISVIAFWLLNIRLHPMSLAGITVSLGIVIDATIVMADHYAYYRNRRAFLGVLAAMLTTIGALVAVFWLPEQLRHDLRDFAVVVMVCLGVSVFVSLLFAPALVSQLGFTNRQRGRPRRLCLTLAVSRAYRAYIRTMRRPRLRWTVIVVVAAAFAYTMRLFAEGVENNEFPREEEEVRLHVYGRMPTGGSTRELNEKVRLVEGFLAKYGKEIKRYETSVGSWGAHIEVRFTDEARQTSFPYVLENKVTGRLITLGGADWATYGVSERGFSNSLDLQHRSQGITIAGYDYDRLYRYAEEMMAEMGKNSRIVDLTVETPGHERQEAELFADYDRRAMATDSVSPTELHATLATMLGEADAGELQPPYATEARLRTVVRPRERERPDLWQLENAFLPVGGRHLLMGDFMRIRRREAKGCIPREGQEYVLRVAFNVLGSYHYADRVVRQTMEKFNGRFPAGFRCVRQSHGGAEEASTQYWLVGLVAGVIFFVCAIMFESLRQSLAVIMLIPTSLMGLFLTYWLTGCPFGSGGFAAMVLLSGLTVNAGIYVVCEYNGQARGRTLRGAAFATVYVRTFNHKIVPVVLTVISTVLGMVPFLFDGPGEQPFWFSLAVGTLGGLTFSLVPLILFFPLLPVGRFNEKNKVARSFRVLS